MRDEELLSGIPRVVEMVKGYGLPEPEYIDMEIGIRVNFYRLPEEIRQAAAQVTTQVNIADNQSVDILTDKATTQVTTQVTTQATTQATTQVTTQAATQVETLIIGIGDGYYRRDELMQLLNLGNIRYFSKSYLVPAIQQGYVTMLYPDKPRHPRQKYYLTEKGKELLKLLKSQP